MVEQTTYDTAPEASANEDNHQELPHEAAAESEEDILADPHQDER